MAVTVLGHINETNGGSKGKHLKSAIDYIFNPEKTQNGILCGAVNCDMEHAFSQMLSTKARWGKVDKRQGYHFVLSFVEGEVTPELAYEIAEEFITRFIGNHFETVFSIHDNTDNIHAHIIFNSVSCLSGRKYHYKKGDWKKVIQPIVNELCEKYQLSTINLDTNEEKVKFQDRKTSLNSYWMGIITEDVKEAFRFSTSFEAFQAIMQIKGYSLTEKQNGILYLKPKYLKRYLPLQDICGIRTVEEVKERILYSERYRMKMNRPPKVINSRFAQPLQKDITLEVFRMQIFRRMYRSRSITKTCRYQKDIKKFRKLQEDYLFLHRHSCKSRHDVKNMYHRAEQEIKHLERERRQIYYQRCKYRQIFEKLQIMEENSLKASCFLENCSFYRENFENYRKAEKALELSGVSKEIAENIREDFRLRLSVIQKKNAFLKKEKAAAERILSIGWEESISRYIPAPGNTHMKKSKYKPEQQEEKENYRKGDR